MVHRRQDGRLDFRVLARDAEHVEIVGTFTSWQRNAVRMERDTDGWWAASVRVQPGDHEFMYLINGRRWQADYAAGGVRLNRFGTWTSLLHVEPEPAIEIRPLTLRAA